MVGFLALVADVGQFYLVRSRLQTAADSAVLAAAQDLAEGLSETVARGTAEDYVDRNIGQAHETNVTFPSGADVRVSLHTTQPTFFGVVFGRSSVPIAAAATAGYGAISSTRDTVPFIVPFQSITDHIGEGHETSYNIGQDNSNSAAENFWWLVNFTGDSGVGESTYADWIIDGYPDPVALGMTGAGTGVKAALKDALEQRMASDPSVLVPLYDFTEAGGGNKNFHVVGFAEFVITGFVFTGNNKNFRGYFTTGTVVDGETSGTPQVDYGVNAVRLKE